MEGLFKWINDNITWLGPALISLVVSVVSLYVSSSSIKKSFKKEIEKQKSNIALEKMSTIPYETLKIFNETAKNDYDDQLKQLKNKHNLNNKEKKELRDLECKSQETLNKTLNNIQELYSTIYAYGSVDAIRIVAKVQKLNYKDDKEKDIYDVMACYILLASQVKKDVTNIVVNPNYWFEMKITDYDKHKYVIKNHINSMVDELKLDKNFKINE